MQDLASRLRTELSDWHARVPPGWRPLLEGVELDFAGVDPEAKLEDGERIWPQETNGIEGVHLFKALWDMEPGQVRVVIFGNDPYTKERQATGRSFEQGDLVDWASDIRFRQRVSPSLQSVLAAAAATDPRNAAYQLIDVRLAYDDYEAEKLRVPIWFAHVELARGLADRVIEFPSPREIFRHWGRQGVLWLNRTATFTRWEDSHRRSHQKLWSPYTRRMLEVLVRQAADHPVVFVLWGSSADDLEGEIAGLAEAAGLPAGSVRTTKTGHPQWPAGYFRNGNPLAQINEALGDPGPAIRWT
jgi:uracil-DNA glycosylase